MQTSLLMLVLGRTVVEFGIKFEDSWVEAGVGIGIFRVGRAEFQFSETLS